MSVIDLFPIVVRQSVPPLGSQEGIDDPTKLRSSSLAMRTGHGTSPKDLQMETTSFCSDSWSDWKVNGESSPYPNWAEAHGPSGFPIERDLHFQCERLSRIFAREHRLNTHLEECA